MGRFFKVFFITFFISIMLVMVGFYSYLRVFNPLDNMKPIEGIDLIDGDKDDDGNDTPLEKALKNSKRINVILVGLEHVRTDTIMVASFDRVNKSVDIISIPRDTLYERPGYTSSGLKINAIYQDEDIDGLRDAVQKILHMPIDKYVTVDYEGVIKGIDELGGVEMDIPFHMRYTDPSDKPPLYIDIPEGRRLLDGKDSIKFLRFRKGDDGWPGYPNGDIGRIEAQQKFIKEATKKLISIKLSSFVKTVYPYIDTNFSTTELLALASEFMGFSIDNLNANVLPGDGEWIGKVSFYIPNNEKIIELVYKMYGILDEEDTAEQSE